MNGKIFLSIAGIILFLNLASAIVPKDAGNSIDFSYPTTINYSVQNVNSSEYWDDLDTPSDISTGDLTDDNTYVEVSGDTMSGALIVDSGGSYDIAGGTDTNDMLNLFANAIDNKNFISIFGNGDGTLFNVADGEDITFVNQDTDFFKINKDLASFYQNVSTTKWFFGKFNQSYGDDWQYLDTSTGEEYFNESKLATTYYNATQYNEVSGTIDGGTLEDTQHPDGDYEGITFNFSEVAGSPGLDLRINFTNVSDFNKGYLRYKTNSLSGDYPVIQLWDYNDNEWEGGYGEVTDAIDEYFTISGDVLDSTDHIQDGVVQMRLYKLANGNTNNEYYIDMLAIVDGYATPSGNVDLNPYWRYDDEEEEGNFTTTGRVTAGELNITGNAYIGELTWNGNLDMGGNNITNTDSFFGSGANLHSVNYTETDPIWTANSTLVPYLASENVFTANQFVQGNITITKGGLVFTYDGSNTYGAYPTGGLTAHMFYSKSAGGNYPFNDNGHIGIMPRSAKDILLVTGSTPKPRLVVDGSTGRVQIGNNLDGAPGSQLEMIGDLDNFEVNVKTFADSIYFSPQWRSTSSRGSLASPTAVTNAKRLGLFAFNGYDGDDYTTSSATLIAEATETHTDTEKGTKFSFETTTAGGITRTVKFLVGDNVEIPQDNIKLKIGASGDTFMFWDGTNFIVNTTTGTFQFKNDTEWGEIEYGKATEHTSIYDLSKGDALDNLPDFENQLTAEGDVNHTALGSICAVDTYETDYSRPEVKEVCSDNYLNGTLVCKNKVYYPYSKVCKNCGIDVGCSKNLALKASSELKERIELLEVENELIKSELCKFNKEYSFCK